MAVLEELYPANTAEPWDSVGLICGDPAQPVRKILLALDVTQATVQEAVDCQADLLITHHPLFLRPVHSVAADTWKGKLVHQLIQAGCALFNAHTNADIALGGVNEALSQRLGLRDTEVLIPRGDLQTSPMPHTGLGRVGNLPTAMSFLQLGELVARVLPGAAQGVRLAGNLTQQVQRIAVVGGSGDSTFQAVRDSGAQVVLTSDLRHHPVSELREQALFAGSKQGQPAWPFVIDVAHYSSETPWLGVLADIMQQKYFSQSQVAVQLSQVNTDPWTAQLACPTNIN